MMGEEELSKIKKSLRSVLISCPEGTPLNKVESDYRSFMGVSLSYQQFGHRNVESFLRSIPDTVRLNGTIAYGVACEEIRHVTRLINNQRKVTSAVKRVQRAKQTPRIYSQPFHNAPRPPGGHPNKYSWHPPPHTPPYKQQVQYPPPYPPFVPSRPPGPHGYHGSYGSPGPHRPPGQPPQHPMRQGSFFPQVGPPMPPRVFPPPPPPPPPHPTQFLPTGPPPPPIPAAEDLGDELIFSNSEILDLLSKEKVPKSPQLVQVLSLAFPYIYRGSHVAILDLSIPLCIDIATAVALDCEEELNGTPAILVCKMQEFHDFCLLESSPKVQCFKIQQFQNTKVKVLTLSFLDMMSLLNTNNEHFYKSTTFVIFVDLQESHMPLLNTLLPPELQYLFLFTCDKMSTNLYTQPHIVIRKWNTQFTDVAYNEEKPIEKLQQKLDYLNGTASLNASVPKATQGPPQVVQNPVPTVNGHSSAKPNSSNSAKQPKIPSPALKQLTESTLKANINLFIQAGPTKGKTSLLLELAVIKVDVTLDFLQIVLTAPNPKTSGQLFTRLKEYVNAKGITEVRAFGYTEGSFDKLNLYITEQKVHILVIENSHLSSLLSKNYLLLKHCKLLGFDELYGSSYTKQVPTSIANCFGRIYSHSTQIIVMTHPAENDELLQSHIPRPSWHIKEHPASTDAKEKYIVTFLNAK